MTALELLIGTIIAWENAPIPAGWQVCDGTNGTPDMRNRFVRGASIDGDVRDVGGNTTHKHTMPDTGVRAAHNHGGSAGASVGGGGSVDVTSGSGSTSASSGHSHSASVPITASGEHAHEIKDTEDASSLPAHIARVFIRRMA